MQNNKCTEGYWDNQYNHLIFINYIAETFPVTITNSCQLRTTIAFWSTIQQTKKNRFEFFGRPSPFKQMDWSQSLSNHTLDYKCEILELYRKRNCEHLPNTCQKSVTIVPTIQNWESPFTIFLGSNSDFPESLKGIRNILIISSW